MASFIIRFINWGIKEEATDEHEGNTDQKNFFNSFLSVFHPCSSVAKNFLNDRAADVSQPEVASLEAEGQARVIDA